MSELFSPDERRWMGMIDPAEMPERTACAETVRSQVDKITKHLRTNEQLDQAGPIVAELWRDLAAYACAYWPTERLPELVEMINDMANQMERSNDPHP